MEKNRIEKGSECPICFPQDKQVVDIMHNLSRILVKAHNNYQPEYKHLEKRLIEKPQEPLSSLLKFIFHQKLQSSHPCNHQIAQKFLEATTKLQARSLQLACENTYQFHAKRNYEFEVLTSQIKCFPKTILQESESKQKQSQVLSPRPQSISNSVVDKLVLMPSTTTLDPSTEARTPVNTEPTYYPCFVQSIGGFPFGEYYFPFPRPQ